MPAANPVPTAPANTVVVGWLVSPCEPSAFEHAAPLERLAKRLQYALDLAGGSDGTLACETRRS